jgi:peptidoglycan/xylan/chitin deacetylase (PgdA/CDA1 family)
MRTNHALGLVAVFLFLILFTAPPVLAKAKNAHPASGMTDSKGHVLHVASSLTPDEYRAAPIVSSSETASPGPAAQIQSPQTLGPNLIENPSLEDVTNGLPSAWKKGGYGTNDRVLSFPVSGHTGSNAAKVTITRYTSGDGKWYPANAPVTPGQQYQFSDYYESSAESEVDVQVTMADGSKKYIVLGKPSASASWKNFSASFTAPSGAASATIFHVLARAGTLTVDDYSLNAVSAGTNLVKNGDFETPGSGGLPDGWLKGGYGSNTRSFSYPVSGEGGGKAAAVTISSYTSGDAAWYFSPIAVPNGIYSYSDSYKSNVSSVVEIQYHHTDGSYTYQDLVVLPPESSFTPESVGFVVPSGVADITIYHLIQDVGALTVDNVSVEAQSGSGIFTTGAVTLTFDNGWLSQYTNAVPKMDEYGFKGTFYIITHELSDYGYSGFVSKQQIKNMYADGQEIGSHTQTHPYLTDLSVAEQRQEIEGSRQDLLALNVGPVDSFAYPFGDYDNTTISLVEGAGYTNARSTINGDAVPDSDHYQLPRFVMLNTTTAAQAEAAIREAVQDKAWIIIELHQVDNSGDTYATAPATFNAIVDYLAQNHVPVVTMQEGTQSLE